METGLEPGERARTWHSLTPDGVVGLLGSDSLRGLSPSDASRRIDEFGPNQLFEPERWTRVRRVGRQFGDVLIWLLLVAAFASGFLIGAWVDAFAILAIVFLNAALGYVQETRADTALDSLKSLGAPRARLIRAGRAMEVDAEEVVPGDILVLSMGDRISADARVIEAAHLEMAEASLTGESLPVEKLTVPCEPEAVVGDRASMVFAGTTVARGRGRAIVVATGMNTEIGAIAASLSPTSPPSPLQRELARIGRRLAMVAVAAGVVVFGAGYAQDYPLETMALTGVALAVAAIPEGLPAVVTVTLAAGLRRMAQRHAIVRRLPAVEALGAVDVICTDKTGTLTRAELSVSVVRIAGSPNDLTVRDGGEAVTRLLSTSALCNDARLTGEAATGSPTEVALLRAALDAGIDVAELTARSPRLDEVAFDSSRKRMSTLNDGPAGMGLHMKGAPEVVLSHSSHAATEDGEILLTEALRRGFLADAERMARGGLRTLAVAAKSLEEVPVSLESEEAGLTYLGLVGLRDKIRSEVPEAVASAREAGVRTVMVTGDHQITAAAIADAAGLDDGQVMHGSELTKLGVPELTEVIGEHRAFARVDPIDKVKIVEAWRSSGATVAMTGDGVNDAPALRAADIGVSMGSGTDVAREASALVLTDDNYATIVHAIDEGRRVFHNIRNVVHYLLSANASEVIYVVVGFLFFGFLGEPLLAVQLLWINLLSDALPALALGLDSPAGDLMHGRPKSGRDILSPRNLSMLVAQGAVLAGAAVVTLLTGYYLLDLPFEEVRTMVFTTMVVSQLIHAVNVRVDGNMRLSPPDRLLVGAILSSLALQVLIVYTGAGHTLFSTVSLSSRGIATVLVASAMSMVAIRGFKVWTAGR